jgi:hypothetical protein
MAVYYYKNSQILAPVSIVSNEPMFDMTTVSLKTRRASQGHQRWELSFNIQPTDNNIEETLLAGIENLNSETMIMPQMSSVLDRFSFSGTATLSTTANANSTTVVINDTITNSGTIPKGYFIKFNTSDKLHIVTSDSTFNSNTGTVNVSIYPKLTQDINSGSELLTGNSVSFSYYKDINNQTGITFTDGVLANPGTITLLEAI